MSKWSNTAIANETVPTPKDFALPESAEELVYVAKLTEQTERYDEMVACMRKLAKIHPEFSDESRNLLSVAYKNLLTSRRGALRALRPINEPVLDGLIAQIETEAIAICQDLLTVLDQLLLPAATTSIAKVFFQKLKGDYLRYQAEIREDAAVKQQALQVYEEAMLAAKALPSSNPIRLGLVLNLSVFYYEVMGDKNKGIDLAVSAKDSWEDTKGEATEEEEQESENIIALLEDNLALWQEVAQR